MRVVASVLVGSVLLCWDALAQPIAVPPETETVPLAQQLLDDREELGLTADQIGRLEMLLARWRSFREALSKRVGDGGAATAREKGDAVLIWQELGRQRVLVDRDALLLLSEDQRRRWKQRSAR